MTVSVRIRALKVLAVIIPTPASIEGSDMTADQRIGVIELRNRLSHRSGTLVTKVLGSPTWAASAFTEQLCRDLRISGEEYSGCSELCLHEGRAEPDTVCRILDEELARGSDKNPYEYPYEAAVVFAETGAVELYTHLARVLLGVQSALCEFGTALGGMIDLERAETCLL